MGIILESGLIAVHNHRINVYSPYATLSFQRPRDITMRASEVFEGPLVTVINENFIQLLGGLVMKQIYFVCGFTSIVTEYTSSWSK